ncbi:hypothetical protein Htur_1430 [Haloterrigena turkmenica DSM 5511]|uniref:Uncharacterized protein n=1 Tax=Haloterrigena turkmenica (strain ATCC 51198 / DSM 5511 / JCM 9101 / NCIMB 13204 / VKM B-1734 / 4k) TaxID=543526 RepID=D2RQ59_HALTV|nr:hypothetical protein [Haloterrigena turkmenica]ADB60318.1 hypothetical protein Htur_1430 [Haloterrigena turkmenica DSM 5511]
MVRRRQLLLATLAAGAAGTAGCLSDDPPDDGSETDDDQSTNSGDDEPPTDLSPAGEGVYRVDVDAVSDRSVSIGDPQEISYAGDPEIVWGYERVVDTDESTESTPEVVVDPAIDTTDDAAHVFLAPVYDADAENWVVRAYADETYYEGMDTHQFWIGRFYTESEEQPVTGHDAGFTEHHDGVYRASLEYGETPPTNVQPDQFRSVFLTNSEWDASALEDAESVLGAVVAPIRVGSTHPDYDKADENDPAPVVELSFEYDPDAKAVTIVHEDGPTFQGEHVQVGFEGGLTETQFSGEVTPGDELTVAVPSADAGEYLAVTWRGPERAHTIVLDRFEIPE